MYVGKAAMVGTLLVMVPLRRERVFAAGLTWLSAALLVGVIDNVAFSAFARGTELGFISIVAAASATYPLIPLVGGVTFLRERFAPNQLVGGALVIAGLFQLALRQ